MSTPPKASRFRIRKVEAAPKPPAQPATQPAAAPDDMPFAAAAADDGFGDLNIAQAAPEPVADPQDREAQLAAIRAEGLTARQLRMARRVANRHGIEAASDHEAVLLLRRRGIDPFQRANVLELLGPEPQISSPMPGSALVAVPKASVPATKPAKGAPPADFYSENERARAIMEMQRDIVRRRRRNFAMLMARLSFFVLLPTLLAGLYYYILATPLYATKSEFLIQQADQASPIAGLGNMFRGTSFATEQDAISVQGYLQSRDAMMRLDKALGFKAHFSRPEVDALQRLGPDATNEDAYRLYSRVVKISYDPTEGVIRMEVSATDPATSAAFSKALLGFAEEQVDQMTQRVREDQMKGARDSYQDAEAKVEKARDNVLALQQKLGVLDPKVETTMTMGELSDLEALLRKKQLEYAQLMDNSQPNQARVQGVKGDIERLQSQVNDLRARMTEGSTGGLSLAQVTGEIEIAQTELQTRQLMLSQSLQQLETARIEANRQVRYLSLSVAPVAPDEPTYPKPFESTAIAFLIFAGIYMMLSLTAAILREQVTS